MRLTTVRCDKCSTPISGGHSIIEFKAGELANRHDAPVDLCSTCASEFVDGLKPRRFELSEAGATAATA